MNSPTSLICRGLTRGLSKVTFGVLWGGLCLAGCVDTIPPDLSYDYGTVREEICGDRILTRSEQCDDGNQIDGDGCSSTCMVESIPIGGQTAGEIPAGEISGGETLAGEEPGGEVMAGEITAGDLPGGDVPAGEEPAGEEPAGEEPAGEEPTGLRCGDGVVGPGEECDDGNQLAGDGCSAACQTEAPSCLDDQFEPNQDVASAQALMVGEQPLSVEAMLCEGDIDIYELPSCAGGALEIVVDFDIASTDLDLRLVDASGRLLNSSAVALAVERLSQNLIDDEPVYLEVYGYLNGEEGAYTINATLNDCNAQVACSVDADCAPQQRCDNGQCVDAPSGCQFDFDCAPTEECVAGECVEVQPPECRLDTDCPAGERCVAGDCTPTMNAECVLDSDCPVGRVCEADLCVPRGPQADDRFEENDSIADATPITAGVYRDLNLLSRDEDYFSVEVSAGGTLDGSISFSHFSGDLELALQDASGADLDISASSSDSESVSWTNRAATSEVVYLVVYGFLTAGNSYELNAQLNGCDDDPVDTLGDDRYEDNDVFQDATSISPSDYTDLTITSGDDDWYVVEVCEGGDIQVDVSFSNQQGNLDAWLYDEALSYLDASFSSTDDESLSASNLRAQSVYIKIYSFGDEADYQLSVSVTGCEMELAPDRLEENDTRETGEPLLPNLYGDLTLTDNDEDWILFEVCEGGTVNVDLTFSHAEGDIDARLYNATGTSVMSALSSTDNETLTYANASAGQYALRVFGYGSNNNLYDLEFSITDCASPGVTADRLEENDTRETASPLSPNLYGDLTLTDDDEDWIIFDVCEGGTITVDITFSHADGDIDARIYNPSGLSVASALSSTDNEALTYTNATAGEYAINIYGYGSNDNLYDLEFSISNCAEVGLNPDRLEENDTRETGEVLLPNLYSNLTITAGDRDWILFDVCEGGTIEVELRFIDANGDLDARLYNPNEVSVVSAFSSDDNETLTYQNASAGRYALEVFSYGDSENSYDLEFTISNCDGGPGEITPDRLEANDTQETAEVLSPNLYSNLTITEGDDDWVAFDVCEGGDIEVEITFSHAEGDLELELYDADGVELDNSWSSSDIEVVNYTDAAAGRYYAYIYGFLGDINSYNLTIRVSCP